MKWNTLTTLYLLCSCFWVALSCSLYYRQTNQDQYLRQAVAGLWGRELYQRGPSAQPAQQATLQSSKVDVKLHLEHRRKGLHYYATYTSDLKAVYQVAQTSSATEPLEFSLTLPSQGGMFSDFQVFINGQPCEFKLAENGVRLWLPQQASGVQQVEVQYRAQGCDNWWYDFTSKDWPSRNFDLCVETNFRDLNFLDGSVSPTSRTPLKGKGWSLHWKYDQLLSGAKVGISLPQKGNPGPRLIQVCLLAPVGLGLYLLILGTLGFHRGVRLDSLQLCFLAASFYSFHLLLVYLGDALGLELAIAISALIAGGIHLSYLERITDRTFARLWGAPTLTIYMVGFSTTLLFQAHRGLTVCLLLVFTLAALMHGTARIAKESG